MLDSGHKKLKLGFYIPLKGQGLIGCGGMENALLLLLIYFISFVY